MPDRLPLETTVTITLARLERLHDMALRYAYVAALTEGGVRQRDGTRRWRLPPEALPYPAATFDEAVDLARAHDCAWYPEGQGAADTEEEQEGDAT